MLDNLGVTNINIAYNRASEGALVTFTISRAFTICLTTKCVIGTCIYCNARVIISLTVHMNFVGRLIVEEYAEDLIPRDI